MARYLIRASYTSEGARALIKEGGSKRRSVVEQMVGGLGGKVEAFYFALGQDDVYVIADVPDPVSAIAISLVVNAAGAVHLSTTPLLTPEEVDAACRLSVNYRAPGA